MEDWKEKFPVGSVWKTRCGVITQVVQHMPGDEGYLLRTDLSNFTTDGFYLKAGCPRAYDLVERIDTPDATPPSTAEYTDEVIAYLESKGYTVTPPPEPKTVEVDFWVNVYSTDRPTEYTWLTKDGADQAVDRLGRIACINIKRTVTEGEGL